jgi:hypothetical protein
MDTQCERVQRRGLMSAAAVLTLLTTAIAPAYGQAPAQPQPALPNVPAGQQGGSRRDDVKIMEVVLTNAVKNGADTLARQMQIQEPGSIIVTGTARARGFVLDGYGVFFIVDVPMMKQSVVWSNQVLLREQRRDFLRQYIANTPDSPSRRYAEQMLRSLDGPPGMPQQGFRGTPSQVASQQPGGSAAPASAATTQQPPPPGMASAQNVPDPLAGAPSLRDPNELYTEAVKTSLITAMIRYSGQLGIGPDEWVTVAAQDSEGPLTPGQLYDASTIVLRVKGSDVAAFLAGKLTAEEVMKKVEVREF